MFKTNGKYHLSLAIWSVRMPDGSYTYSPGDAYKSRKEKMANYYGYDCVLASADNIYGSYSQRYTAAIGAGHNSFFKDSKGNWWATMFGNPKGDLLQKSFVCKPALVPMKQVQGKFTVDRQRV